jgi:hypothetical protein
MGIGAIFRCFIASFHQIKETDKRCINKFIMSIPTLLITESTFGDGIVVTGVFFEVVGKFALSSVWAIILVV